MYNLLYSMFMIISGDWRFVENKWCGKISEGCSNLFRWRGSQPTNYETGKILKNIGIKWKNIRNIFIYNGNTLTCIEISCIDKYEKILNKYEKVVIIR